MLSSTFSRLCLAFLCLFLSWQAQALTVNATGQAAIINGDVDSARARAIEDARQAASLQAAAYISASQGVDNGVLTHDAVDIRSLTTLKDINIVSEKIRSGIIHIQISAQIDNSTQRCSNDTNPQLKKTVAFTLFRLEHRYQANRGRIGSIQTEMPTLITESLRQSPVIQPFNASRVDIVGTDVTAPTRQLPDGLLTNSIENPEPMHAQYIVAGIIRDLDMGEPAKPREKNILQDWYDRADYASHKHRRTMELDIYLYDGISGSLLDTRHYSAQGFWRRPEGEDTGFATPLFWREDFGKKVKALMNSIADDLTDDLRCKPMAARISEVKANQVWITAGHNRGVSKGDIFHVLRRKTHYDTQLRSFSEFNDTGLTVTIDHVEATFSRGTLSDEADTYNVNPEDVVRAVSRP